MQLMLHHLSFEELAVVVNTLFQCQVGGEGLKCVYLVIGSGGRSLATVVRSSGSLSEQGGQGIFPVERSGGWSFPLLGGAFLLLERVVACMVGPFL